MAKWNGILALVLIPVQVVIALNLYLIAIPANRNVRFGLFALAFAGIACGFNTATYFATHHRSNHDT